MKKLTSLLLATLLLLASFAGCANNTTPGDDTGDSTTPADTTTEATTEPKIVPDVPADKKYTGYEFKVLTSDEVGTARASFEIAAEADGDVMNEAVYKRNVLLEEALGVKVSHIKGVYSSTGWIKDFTNAVTAGDDPYDILVADQTNILGKGPTYGAEVAELPYVDLSKPWWDELVIAGTALAGKTYGLVGDLNVVDEGATWCIIFNKNLADNHGIKSDSLYQLVRDKKWTLDKYMETMTQFTSDTNGDGVRDMYDIWGNVTSTNGIFAKLWSCGGTTTVLDKDGKPSIILNNEKNLTIMNKLYSILSESGTCITNEETNKNFNLQRSIFIEGRGLYIDGLVNYIPIYLRDMEDEFGVLPNPMWDEAQGRYYATVQEWAASAWMAPRVGKDLERTSIILEMMCYLSQDTIQPAYYDQLLTTKTVRDEQSAEMLDIIFAARTVYDTGIAFNWGKLRDANKLLKAEANTIASSLAANMEAYQAAADKGYDSAIAAAAAAAGN